LLNESKGIQAPMYTKHPQFSTRSITEENTSFSVISLKCWSQEIALPEKIQYKYGEIGMRRTASEGGEQIISPESTRDACGVASFRCQ
jgi:hypothetical protein